MNPARAVWGLAEPAGARGLLVAFTGVAVAAAMLAVGQATGLPGVAMAVVAFVVLGVHAVLQPVRLTFTDAGLRHDGWLLERRRRQLLAWSQVRELRLDRGDEGPDVWRVEASATGQTLRHRRVTLLLAGSTVERPGEGWLRGRHLDRHARLLAAFDDHGVPLVDSGWSDPGPRPIGSTSYAQFLWQRDMPGPPATLR